MKVVYRQTTAVLTTTQRVLLPAKVAAARSQSLTVGVTGSVKMQATAAQTMTVCAQT